MLKPKALKAEFLLCVAAMIWGSAFVAQRLGMAHVGPFTYNGTRFLLGSLSLLPLLLIHKPANFSVQSNNRWLIWMGCVLAGLLLFAGASLQQVGIVYTTAGKAGFITGLYVVLVPILGLLWGQRTPWATWVGIALAVIGLYLLTVTEDLTLAKGDGLVLIGAFFWAGHVLVIGWLSGKHVEPIVLAWFQFMVCAVLSLIVAFVMEPISLAGLESAALPILYGGVLSVGVAYTLQVVAQRDAPPAHAAIILSLETVFAVLAGWVMLQETLSNRALIGCGLMFAGMLSSQLGTSDSIPALDGCDSAEEPLLAEERN